MADAKLSSLGAIPAYAFGDLLYIVDVSDATQSPQGSSKKTTVQDLFNFGGSPILGVNATDAALAKGILITAGGILKANRAGGNISLLVSQSDGIDSIAISSGQSAGSGGHVRWYTDAGAFDTSLRKRAPGILYVGDGSTGNGWLQQAAGRSRVTTAAVTNNTVTPANITGLSANLVAGRNYTGVLALMVSNTVAADGLRIDFDGGTATMTSFEAGVTSDGVPAATFSVSQSSALATDLIATTVADTNSRWITIHFGMVVNAAGTFIPRFALEAASTGVVSIHPNSWMMIEDCP